MGDAGYNTVCGWDEPALEIDVYDRNSYYQDDEEINVVVNTPLDEVCHTLTGEDIFFKEGVKFGKSESNDVQCQDGYVSSNHCEINTKKWFKKKTPWVKEYLIFLKTKSLPLAVCRQIFEFLKEPRRVVIKDLGSQNGTFVSLPPSINYRLNGHDIFRFGNELEMIIETPKTVELRDDQTINILDERVDREKLSKENSMVIYDNYLAGEEASRNYNILSVLIRFIRKGDICWNFVLVSNKKKAGFSIGSSVGATIPLLESKNIEANQCEIVLDDGKWHLKELYHEDRRKRTWIGLYGEPEDRFKRLKNKGYPWISKPKRSEIEITEDREILIGRMIIELSLGRRGNEVNHH